jgi:O-antigen/teichoic acid export membrane protein
MQSPVFAKRAVAVDHALGLRVFGSNSFWLWLDRGALRIGTLLAGLVLIRYLGPSNYGVYVMAIATGAVVNIITDCGLTRYGARTAAAWPEEIPRILTCSLLITAVSFVLEFVTFGVALAAGHDYVAAIAAGLILTNFEGTATLCSALLTGDLRSREILPASIFSVCAVIAIVLIAVWQHFTVLELLSALAIKSFCVVGLRLLQMHDWWPTSRSFKRSELSATIHRAWPFFSYALVEIAYSQLPIFCLGLVTTKKQVGLFAAAMVIANILPQWLFASSDALLPIITKLHEAGEAVATSAMMQKVIDLFVMITLPLAIALSTLAPIICSLMGRQFRSSGEILSIAAFLCVLTAIGTLLGSVYLTAINRVRQRRDALAICAIITLVLLLLVGKLYGGVGAVICVVCGNVAIDVAYFRLCRNAGLDLNLTPMLSAFLAGTVAMLIAWLTHSIWQSRLGISGTALLTYLIAFTLFSRQSMGSAWGTLRECTNLRSGVQL